MLATATIVATILCGAAFAQTTLPPNSICAGRPVGFFVRDVRQCNAFFRCAGQGAAPTWGVCNTQGSVFSEPRQRCVWASEMECFSCPAGEKYAQLEVESACGQFIRCIDERPQHMECARGLLFDTNRGTCNLAAQVRCGAPTAVNCPARDDPNNRVWWRDQQDCALFAVCVNGRPVRRSCAAGLSFNTRSLQCDFPQNTDCQGGVVQPPPGGEFSCAAQDPLPRPIYPHPTDCRLYFVCAGTVAHPRECPPDTLFDIVQQVCDHPERAVCGPGARRLEMVLVGEGGAGNVTIV